MSTGGVIVRKSAGDGYRMSGIVVVVQRRLTHYRVPLFERLREELASRGLHLLVAHGQPTARELSKRDGGHLSWAVVFWNRYMSVGAMTLCWQSIPSAVRRASLVVVTQESSILSNYALQLQRFFGGPRIAYWGHGRNFQTDSPDGLSERWKRLWLKKVDWWFAYTQVTADYVIDAGYPAARITCLDNAIDTREFRQEIAAASRGDIGRLRVSLGIPSDALVGLFCGSLYSEKRLGLLVEAADRIRAVLPNFHLTIIGDGPEASWVRAQTSERPWLHATGALHGRSKAAWYATADVVLNPGGVGLGILDAFTAGLPIVTTRTARHGPEIVYLRHEVNGLMTEDDVLEYAGAVINLLTDQEARGRMARSAYEDSMRYTIENMARRFADGIERALAEVEGPRG